MLSKKCMVAAAISAGIVTASFALVASEEPAGVTMSPYSVEVESSAGDPPPLDLKEHCPGMRDCNGNGVDDRCDLDCSNAGIFCVGGYPAIAGCDSGFFASCGTSEDCDSSGVPDECESAIECCDGGDCGLFECCGQITPYTCDFCIE